MLDFEFDVRRLKKKGPIFRPPAFVVQGGSHGDEEVLKFVFIEATSCSSDDRENKVVLSCILIYKERKLQCVCKSEQERSKCGPSL